MQVKITTPSGTSKYDLSSFHKNIITFGRSSSNDIVIKCPIVSGRHGTLEKRSDGWYIVDNNSTNGIISHGNKVKEHKLGRGSNIDIHYENMNVKFVFDASQPIAPLTPAGPQEVRGNVNVAGGVSVLNSVNVNNNGTPLCEIPEREIYRLDQDKLHGFLSGNGIRSMSAVVTNKKVILSRDAGLINRTTLYESVDVDDVTGVKLLDNRPWLTLGIGVLLVLLSLIFLILASSASTTAGLATIADETLGATIFGAGAIVKAVVYKVLSSTFFFWGIVILIVAYFRFCKIITVQYAGGYFGVRFKFISYAEVTRFVDAIRIEKENYTKTYGDRHLQ